jgi:putative ABC transport system substrate-binding protein
MKTKVKCKRIAAVFLSAMLIGTVLTGCTPKQSPQVVSADTQNNTSSNETATGGKTFVVGISQYVTVTPLDLAREGFKERLDELAKIDGNTIEYDEKNASADVAQAQTIAQTFVSKKVDLICALATPSATTAKSEADNRIPVVFCAITDPADEKTALVQSYEKTGGNITGASDKTPMEQQLQLFSELYNGEPIKKIAMIHSAEPNALAQVAMMQEACNKLGITLVAKTIASTSELQAQFQAISNDKDIMGIYIGADNTVADGAANIKTLNEEITRLPIVVNDEGLMKDTGATAAYGFEYREMGKATADIAYEILTGKKKAEDIPVYFQPAEKLRLALNFDEAKTIGFTIPDALKERLEKQLEANVS